MNNTPGWRGMTAMLRDVKGATAIEYALIAASVAVIIVGAVTAVGDEVAELFNSVLNGFQSM